MYDVEEKIRENYQKREKMGSTSLYSMLNPACFMTVQEKERLFVKWMKWASIANPQNMSLLEIGCGTGTNILEFIRLGFDPDKMVANELLEARIERAKKTLPSGVKIVPGDAMAINEPVAFDIVMQSTVFSSILDDEFQEQLAKKMWSWVKVGGGVLWYDFIYNNPRNKDVAGVPISRVKFLFPEGKIKYWRVTLAPPLARFVTKLHPLFYSLFNTLPCLRTHVLCWIQKTEA